MNLCTVKAPLVGGTAPTTTLYARWIDITDTEAVLAELANQASNLLDGQHSNAANLDAQVVALQEQINDALARLSTTEMSVALIPSIQASISSITDSLVALTGEVDAQYLSLTNMLADKFELIDDKFLDAANALLAARTALSY